MTTLERFISLGAMEEASAIERLRFFCSLCMVGRDWLDVEQFFNGVDAELSATKEKLADEMERHAQLQSRCYDQGGTFSNVFDELSETKRENDKLRKKLESYKPTKPVGATTNEFKEQKMRICWDRGMFWHVDCKAQPRSAIMKEQMVGRIECLCCGKIGIYPIGGSGEICCDEVITCPPQPS